MPRKEDLLEGAEPFEMGDGATGVLLIHGFTGSPQSMRPWGKHLGSAGYKVSCPLLPGHGTRWQDMQVNIWRDWVDAAQESLDLLSARTIQTYVAGLSMGGTIACYLAAENQDAVSGLITVAAGVFTRDPRAHLLPILKYVIPSFPGVSNDIAEEGQEEVAYDRLPLKAAAELLALQAETRERLGKIRAPALLFHSREDHVVEPANMPYIAEKLGSDDIRMRWLRRSYHVATLDYDRQLVFTESERFIADQTCGGSPVVGDS